MDYLVRATAGGDEMDHALAHAVLDGTMALRFDAEGAPQFQLTEHGRAWANELLLTDSRAQELWGRLRGNPLASSPKVDQ